MIILPCMIIVASMITGCQSSDRYGEAEARAVTSEEADRLAVMRFNNYDRRYAAFTMSLTERDTRLWLDGRVDFHDHLGYAGLLASSDKPSYALVQWDQSTVAATASASATPPAQPPTDAPWEARALDPERDALDTALTLVLQLAIDRPENPVLLRQNGAQWHGRTTVEDTPVDVISGPGSDNRASDRLLYFIDATGKLVRVTARVGNTPDPVVITFGSDQAAPITKIDELG